MHSSSDDDEGGLDLKLIEFDGSSEATWKKWIDSANAALKETKGLKSEPAASSDPSTHVFLLGVDSPIANVIPHDSIWFECFSPRLRDFRAKIIKLSRHDVLRRAVEVAISNGPS